MSKETREHLSALVDGEISRETSRFLVRRLGVDEELRATWTRYHLVRDCLRHQDGSIAGEDLCARVSTALKNDRPVNAKPVVPVRWLKPVAGMAIAASVALMAIVAVGPGIPGTSRPGTEVADETQPAAFVSPKSLRSTATSAVSLSGGANSRDAKLNSYLLRHYQATGAMGGKGFVAFVPVVITGSKTPAEAQQGEDGANPETEKDQDAALR